MNPGESELAGFDEAWAERVRVSMGQARLNPAWAKLEILIGLGAAAVGTKLPSDYATLGIALMALGGYLAMAGHRSHLYQSQNRQTAYLLQLMKRE